MLFIVEPKNGGVRHYVLSQRENSEKIQTFLGGSLRLGISLDKKRKELIEEV